MPTAACPSCGTLTRVPPKRLGQSMACPKCHGQFIAVAESKSWTRVFHRRNPVGLWAGVALLLSAGILAAAVIRVASQGAGNLHAALFGRDATLAGRIVFFVAAAAAVLGVWLVHRWYRATHRWPYG
jgi:hypothetical protein